MFSHTSSSKITGEDALPLHTTQEENSMTYEEILKKYGASDIERYSLISNYGYTFYIGENKYDIRFWANCYGAEINKWQIMPCTKGDDGKYIPMDRELSKKIEEEFNAKEAI